MVDSRGNIEGLNNVYHANVKSSIALDYSYSGILEQMHVSKTMNFLSKKAGFIMNALKPAEKDKARRIISKAILATDMVSHQRYSQTKHFRYVDQLRDKTGNHLPISVAKTSSLKSHRPLNKEK